jgi:molybdenum cofactor cytidylyltransferase
MNCGALILAAGASSRLGTPKQLVRLRQETLLYRSIRISKEAGCSPVVVVLGAFEDQIRRQCNLQDTVVVSHAEWADGMGTSLARGIEAFNSVTGAVVMTCDMPAVTATHLVALQATGEVTASRSAERRGVPAYFPCAVFPELLKIRGDAGARDLLRSAAFVELIGGELDIDTAEELTLAMTAFG